jgi:hypothetical protein
VRGVGSDNRGEGGRVGEGETHNDVRSKPPWAGQVDNMG